ncbi:MAG TPA: acetate/propionate family kinase [Polyangiaceae bacterium]|nr:acetate/propionate family kinase [Polyangiaceae bacterium]
MRVLLLNAGSSSLKCTLVESAHAAIIARASADWAGPVTRYERSGPGAERVSEQVSLRGHADAVRYALADLGVAPEARSERPAAVGHRIVHGGEFSASVRITPAVRSRISALAELAPLHNPPGLDVLGAAEALLPGIPHVAVFDTAFHATLPPAARTYALPDEWTRDWGIRRYGFHGINHSYCAGRAAEMLARDAKDLRLVICHLGHGCSATAVLHGRSVDTTMGFTPLDGLMMATRSGSVDPGILTHVQLQHGLGAKEVEEALNHRSGLLGVSGISGDMREVLAAGRSGNEQARLAVDVYAHRVRQAIGALAVTLGGVDALVFTGGVGENSDEVRAATCRGLECLGLELDEDANARCRPDADVTLRGARARILMIAAREDLAMLAEVVRVISPSPESAPSAP